VGGLVEGDDVVAPAGALLGSAHEGPQGVARCSGVVAPMALLGAVVAPTDVLDHIRADAVVNHPRPLCAQGEAACIEEVEAPRAPPEVGAAGPAVGRVPADVVVDPRRPDCAVSSTSKTVVAVAGNVVDVSLALPVALVGKAVIEDTF